MLEVPQTAHSVSSSRSPHQAGRTDPGVQPLGSVVYMDSLRACVLNSTLELKWQALPSSKAHGSSTHWLLRNSTPGCAESHPCPHLMTSKTLGCFLSIADKPRHCHTVCLEIISTSSLRQSQRCLWDLQGLPTKYFLAIY